MRANAGCWKLLRWRLFFYFDIAIVAQVQAVHNSSRLIKYTSFIVPSKDVGIEMKNKGFSFARDLPGLFKKEML
jgi:hypothetical protein